jgi:hypothetical protein
MKADHISKARRHQDLPNIGPSMARDLALKNAPLFWRKRFPKSMCARA